MRRLKSYHFQETRFAQNAKERFKEWGVGKMLWLPWKWSEDGNQTNWTWNDPTEATYLPRIQRSRIDDCVFLWVCVEQVISDKDRCSQCKGSKVTQEKVLEVHVDKGMQHGRKMVFQGEADEAPDTITRDIDFVLQLKEHPKFRRKFDDLYVEHTLSLTEALCGFKFALTHVDGRQLLIKPSIGEVIKPDQYKAINDEGMPHYQRSFMKGRLYIHFNVEFPEFGVLFSDQLCSLEAVLPPRPSSRLSTMELDECEEITLYDVNFEDEMRQKQQQRQQEAYDEDDDEPGTTGVQCAQQ